MKRSVKIIIAIVALLVVARLLLPWFVLRYVNKTLADMGDYTGHVDDITISLLRGAYQIEDLVIKKENGKIKEPFVKIPRSDLSIEWKSLLKGRLVGEVECYNPELNFSFTNNESTRQTGEGADWTQVVTDLLPIQINRFAVINGRVDLLKLFTQANADLSLLKVNGELRNIRNVEEKAGKLPSPVWLTGDVPGYGGNMRFDANMYLLKDVPDFNYDMKFTDLQLVKLNPLVREYANLDFEKGTMSVFSEMAMNGGKLNGYLKPLTKDMTIFRLKEPGEKRTIGRFFTELLAEAGSEVLENQKRDQVATRVPLTGTVENIDTPIWPTLFGVLRNAYVQAFEQKFDNDVTFKDALQSFKEDFKEKRAERKAERKQRRAERKAERKAKREAKKREKN
ncbi:DUF748 domain-containing protein [Fibrivirga algicola]|uniref:DUF748 domain-containing protein n=1 Tax=Fibrivirga algicola TaxID=2950420 RepID=A0ABX0QA96_9BACT|nr:DUF748 domain-containing protein [Fibrivirga algicola]ARK08938.1 hypothetical protein A6C57_00655 [Fibrella sp. ES10-3-2-2]NID08884.1 DUF748 domain-containing protein [Fibrivirga algicola]